MGTVSFEILNFNEVIESLDQISEYNTIENLVNTYYMTGHYSPNFLIKIDFTQYLETDSSTATIVPLTFANEGKKMVQNISDIGYTYQYNPSFELEIAKADSTHIFTNVDDFDPTHTCPYCLEKHSTRGTVIRLKDPNLTYQFHVDCFKNLLFDFGEFIQESHTTLVSEYVSR